MQIRKKAECRWDLVSLGEVMLRFDPGEKRLTQARQFEVWEGGGEYNVARGLSSCFGGRASIVTALVRNPVGALIESLVRQGGVDVSHVHWLDFDGMGTAARNGLYFLERGFGVRGALGCMDRGHTAVSQMKPGMVDWESTFGREGARWFHTGGIFCALSDSTLEVAKEAMQAAKRHGAAVSFDCNYRPSLWRERGGRQAAARANRELAQYVDVFFGDEGDLLLEPNDRSNELPKHTDESYAEMASRVLQSYPNFHVIATTVREVRSATSNDFGAFAFAGGSMFRAPELHNLEILDRVGAGDSFASGLIYGLLEDKGMDWALKCGMVHGALTMTTAGDNSFATLAEIERMINGGLANVQR
ncbi:MAG TPA: sugar kinase [Silvibacterium sp.]|nr:sugar kinase [Silvibacterium sp.]